MKVKPVLGDWEIPRIGSIQSSERRVFVELPVPGKVGSLYQDMNSAPARIAIAGSLYGDEARDDFLGEVRGKFREGTPMTFVGDIVTATELQYVVIESLRFEENGLRPDQTDFLIVLKESPPPPPPPDPFGGLDAGLLDQAAGFLDTVTGALDALEALGNVPDFQDPTGPLTDSLGGLTSATAGLEEALQPLKAIFGSPD
jgi:hypothetical protein